MKRINYLLLTLAIFVGLLTSCRHEKSSGSSNNSTDESARSVTDLDADGIARMIPMETFDEEEVEEIEEIEEPYPEPLPEPMPEAMPAPASKPDSKTPDPDQIFVAEQVAQFPGGDAALMKWLANNIRYPQRAQEEGIQGKVIVKVVIEKDGRITDPVIVKGVDKDLDREAIRVVRNMPSWKPGMNNGQVVRSYFFLPISFNLQ